LLNPFHAVGGDAVQVASGFVGQYAGRLGGIIERVIFDSKISYPIMAISFFNREP
jgi:hypothetical protein